MLDIIVQENFSLAPIDWNYEQVKAQVAEYVETYKGLVVSADAIPVAKSDLAWLRKLAKSINDRKIEVRKQWEQPYKAFEAQVKDLIALVDEAISGIDGQVKAYEQAEKDKKRGEIAEYFEANIGDLRGFITLDRIWNDRWLNAGSKMADIQAEISAVIDRLKDDVYTVKAMNSPFVTELLHTLFRTLDLSAVIKHQQTLTAIAAETPPPPEEPMKEPEKYLRF